MTRVERHLLRFAEVYGAVERRLEEAGATEELHHLHRMSDDELDLLVKRERGLGW